MSGRGGVTLKQLDHANHQQDGRPRLVKFNIGDAVQQEEHAQSNHDRWPHEPPGPALFAIAAASNAAQQPPMFREEPHPQQNQSQRNQDAHADFEQACSVQKKQNAQADQNRRSCGNLGAFKLLARAERCPQPEWIGHRLSQLQCFCGANRVDDLVDVEEANPDPQDRVHVPGHLGTDSHNQQHHDDQVCQSLGVL